MSSKAEIIEILKMEDSAVDSILKGQAEVYSCVKDKNWTDLTSAIENVNKLSDEFFRLDCKRDEITKEKAEYLKDKEVTDLLYSVRVKLSKSKIENAALNAYVTASSKFISGVLDECIPRQKNTLYTNKGVIRKPQVQSVLVNQVM